MKKPTAPCSLTKSNRPVMKSWRNGRRVIRMSDEEQKRKAVLKEVYEAGRAEDAETQLQEHGKELINRFYMLYRTGRVHSLDNEATRQSVETIRKLVDRLNSLIPANTLILVGETFYLNKVMLKP